MKKLNYLLISGLMLMTFVVLLTGCKKDEDEEEPITAAFVVTATPDGDYLKFYFYCSTTDVNLTKVTIIDPLLNQYTYNAGGTLFVKDELVEITEWYPKQLGTWKFTFVGNITANGDAFSYTFSLPVTGK